MLPWAEMFRGAISRGVSPAQFWRLSVREWRWLFETRPDGLHVDDLKSLMEMYPDG